MNEASLIVTVFIATTVCMAALAFFVLGVMNSEGQKVKKRLESINPNYKHFNLEQHLQSRAGTPAFPGFLKKANDWERYALVSSAAPWLNLPLLFAQAGMTASIGQWLLVSAAMGLAAAVGVWLLPSSLTAVLGAGAAVLLLRYGHLLWKRKQRLNKYEAHLAQALEIISRSLRAGHPLSMGIYMVSTELPDPIGIEFGQVFHQQQMGLPLNDALKSMAQRVPLIDLRFFVLSIMIHRQTGGDLAEVMDNLSRVIRERFKVLGQVKALTAEGRLSGWVLSLLPVCVFFILMLLNRDYVMLLVDTERGQTMLWFAVVMQIIGMFVIKKIVNIKV